MTTEIAVSTELSEALNSVLEKFCSSCGEQLPSPGVQCICGKLPAITLEEATEALSTPGALTARKADQATEAAEAACDEFVALAGVPDRLYGQAQLEQALDEAERQLVTARAKLKTVLSRVRQAKGKEEKTGQALADAWKLADDDKTALEVVVRTKASPVAERDARRNLTASEETLKGYQADHAVSVRELNEVKAAEVAARQDVSSCEANVATAEKFREQLGELDPGYSPDRVRLLARPLLLAVEELAGHPEKRGDEIDLFKAVVYTLAGSLGLNELIASTAADIPVTRTLAGTPLQPFKGV